MPKPKRIGYNTEKAVANFIGGERVGTLGAQDVRTSELSIEVKHRMSLPKKIKSMVGKYGVAMFVADHAGLEVVGWMCQAVRNAPLDKIPILWLHEKHWRT